MMTGQKGHNMKNRLFIIAEREGYTPEQCGNTMTVGELINFLMDFDEDMPIYLSHDGGYTYGAINDGRFEEEPMEEEE